MCVIYEKVIEIYVDLSYCRIEVKSANDRVFHSTGLHFFYLGTHNADWLQDQAALICVVKVTQKIRCVTLRLLVHFHSLLYVLSLILVEPLCLYRVSLIM